MSIDPNNLLAQIFGKQSETPKTSQSAVQASTPQFDFSKMLEQPSSDSYMPPFDEGEPTDEPEELDEYADAEGQPQNTFSLNFGSLGFSPPTPQIEQPKATPKNMFDLSALTKSPVADQPTNYVSPYEGKVGKHPNNCDCSKHRGQGVTPENVAQSFPLNLQTMENQKSGIKSDSPILPQTNRATETVNVDINKKTLQLIGEGLETIGRAIKSIAENS